MAILKTFQVLMLSVLVMVGLSVPVLLQADNYFKKVEIKDAKAKEDLSAEAINDAPNNFLAFYRIDCQGNYTQIQPSQIRGPNVAVLTHGLSIDVKAMTVLGKFLANFHKNNCSSKPYLYDDVVVFQYDSYHTSIAASAQYLVTSLQSLSANVKKTDLYGYSLGNAVNRFAYERLGLGTKLGDLTSRVLCFAGLNYGVPTAVLSGISAYIGLYIPSLLVPPPVALLTDLSGGLTDSPYDPLRSDFMKQLNDLPNPFAYKTSYYAIVGNTPGTITPNSDSIAGSGLAFDLQYRLLDGTPLMPASDAVLSIRNALGIGVLEGRGVSVRRAIVAADHLSISGLKSFLGPVELPASGYVPIAGSSLLPAVQNQLTSWLQTF